MNFKSLIVAAALGLPLAASAQLDNTPPDNWQHLDKLRDGYMGVSADKAYDELLKGKTSKTVIVAVIDSGVDPQHEDLKDVMWKNPGEIPGNGKDDDGNGYADDIHGWNFIGGKDGRNVHHDQLEITRLVAGYAKKYKNADPAKLSGADKKEYDKCKEMEAIVTDKREEGETNLALYGGILEAVSSLEKAIGKPNITAQDLEKFKTDDPKLSRAAAMMSAMLGEDGTLKEVKAELQKYVDHLEGQAKYNYNLDLDSRAIVGDNYADPYERYYGNPDVKGADASHGTCVAGVIAAGRSNDLGMEGIADNVRIMALRCVPDGDERDKDVANAIIYAVDNGATVINMSFGKGYSPEKEAVDKAVKYAMKHDVLLVHASGNEGQNNDEGDHFPTDKFKKSGLFSPKVAKNWIDVGALSWEGGEDAPAYFSNYGKETVDLFAPGVAIYSATPGNSYDHSDGTSVASPVVAGVAALIRSYFPDLTAEQVKDVLMSSTVMTKDNRVKTPSDDKNGKLVPFTELCVTGGAVNAYEAVKKASTVKGKKKAGKGATGKGGGKAGKKASNV